MIKLFKPFMPLEVDAPLLETLHSGMITQGPKVEEFEKKLGGIIQNPHVLSVNSGTSALTLALRLADLKPGDEVISTPMTCSATNLPVMQFGARIVWADVDPETGLISPQSIISKLTDKTKVILTVDWAGTPVDYKTIRMIADAKRIAFISDAAHSLGATYNGVPVGHASLAHMTCFSLQAIKTITTVDGGAISFGRSFEYKRGKLLRWFGIDRENSTEFRGSLDIKEAGYKFHMNDINATIGIVALDFLRSAIDGQRLNALKYYDELDKYFEARYDSGAHWLEIIKLPDSEVRKEFIHYMKEHDIEVSQVHWRNDELTVFIGSNLGSYYYTGLESYSNRMIAIPNHHQLTKDEISYIIRTMNEFPR